MSELADVKAEVKSMSSLGACKCPRCLKWHYVKENFDNLCDRCCEVLVEDFPDHWSVAGIKEAYEAQRVKYGVTK